MRSGASVCHDLADNSVPRGARISRGCDIFVNVLSLKNFFFSSFNLEVFQVTKQTLVDDCV